MRLTPPVIRPGEISARQEGAADSPPSMSTLSIAPIRVAGAPPAWPGISQTGKCTAATAGCAVIAQFQRFPDARAVVHPARSPRSVRKLSNGEPVRHYPPDQLFVQSGIGGDSPPADPSLWPLMYLVVECTTRSAPSAIGVCNAGDRKVLSATTRARHGAASATKRMSVMRSSGLKVSIQTTFRVARQCAGQRGSVLDRPARNDPYTVTTCGTPDVAGLLRRLRFTSVIAAMPVDTTIPPAPPSSSASIAEQVTGRVAAAGVIVAALATVANRS